jgi:predicted nucleic acid-binding protein
LIVIDASAVVDLLTGQGRSSELLAWATADPQWVVPEHLLLEVTSGLRGEWLAGRLDEAEFRTAIDRLDTTQFLTWPTGSLLRRIAELARNATPYDAAYIALAERLNLPLLTADAKLARIPGIICRVIGPAAVF